MSHAASTRARCTAPGGLHGRVLAGLILTAREYDADVWIGLGGKRVRADSFSRLFTLPIGARDEPDTVEVEADGADAEEAVRAVAEYLEDRDGWPVEERKGFFYLAAGSVEKGLSG